MRKVTDSKISPKVGPLMIMALIATATTQPNTGVVAGLQKNGVVITEAQQHAANRNKSKLDFTGKLTFDFTSTASLDHLLVFDNSALIDYTALGGTVVNMLGHSQKVAGQWISTIPVYMNDGVTADGHITVVVNGGAISVDQAVQHILESRPYVSDIKMVANTDNDTVQFTKVFGYIEQPTGKQANVVPLTSIIKQANPNSKDAADTRWFVPNPNYPADKSGKEWSKYRDFYYNHGAGLNFSMEFATPIHGKTAF